VSLANSVALFARGRRYICCNCNRVIFKSKVGNRKDRLCPHCGHEMVVGRSVLLAFGLGLWLVRCSRRDYGQRCEVPAEHFDNDSRSRPRDLRGPRVQQAIHVVPIFPNTGACVFGVAPDAGGGWSPHSWLCSWAVRFCCAEEPQRSAPGCDRGMFSSVLWYSQGSGGVRTTAGNGQ